MLAIIIEKGFALNLESVLRRSLEIYGDVLTTTDGDALVSAILDFVLTRVKGLFKDSVNPKIPGGFAFDTIDAVAAATISWHDLSDFVKRLEALQTFRGRDDFADLAATFKRCNNILKKAIEDGTVNADLFEQAEETALLDGVQATEAALADRLPKKDYVGALEAIAPLRSAVDSFFDKVMVNADDLAIRKNRKLLLQRVVTSVMNVADFSAIH
jgi:glycyl-tRNA synthetase beta chain